MKIVAVIALAFAGLFLLTDSVHAETSILDLVLPQFEIRDATFLEALAALKPYGVQVGVELKPAPFRQELKKFDISLPNASLRTILDTIIRKEGDYSWREVNRPCAAIVNIFPTEPKLRFDELFNIRVSHFEIRGTLDPTNTVHKIGSLAPELSERLGGWVGSTGKREGEEFWFIRENTTLRDLLNDIVLHKRGLGWIFKPIESDTAPNGFYYSWSSL